MVSCAAVFSDHMVLQREKPIPVWGSAAPGQAVTVSLGDNTVRAEADRDGRWLALLPPTVLPGPYELTAVSGEEELQFRDVLVGEVWLAGGQSNMEMPLRDCGDGRREIASSSGRGVRFYNVPRCAVLGSELERAEGGSRWEVCSPETSGDMSGAAWFFASQIAQALSVPVGIIVCCLGGTSVSCWMSREQLGKTVAGQEYIDSYTALVDGKSEAEYRREMAEYNELWSAWDRRVQALRQAKPRVSWEEINRVCGVCPWPQPAGDQSPFRPGGLYLTMLRRVCPYGLRGFILFLERKSIKKNFNIALKSLQYLHFPHSNEVYF